jgi:hypothetical protein
MTRGNNYDDEALARALQIEYEKEYRRRSMQQHLSINGGSERSSRNPVAPTTAPTAPLRPPPPFAPSAPIDNIYIEEDTPYLDRSDLHRLGSHRGAAGLGTAATPTGSVTVPRHSFTVADDDAFGSVEISDEAFARQLEQELMQEELLRNQRKQHLQQQRDSYRASNRGTSERMDVPPPPQGRVVSTTPVSARNNTINPNSQSYTSDYAARSSHSRTHSLSAQNSFSGRPSSTKDIADSRGLGSNRKMMNESSNMWPPAVTGTAMIYSDEELAMRLQQEMRDEELARQEFIEEQIRQSSIAARSMGENNRSSRQRARSGGRSSCRRTIGCLLSLVLVGIAVALFLYFYLGADKVKDIIGDPSNFKQEDPFSNANKADANLWKTKGGVGLELVVVNALDSTWQDYFFKAVGQWDAGTPDALTLTTEDSTPDSVCNAIDGKLKVCNGNYGATNWRGINKVLLENGWIYSSAARMNEYYTTDNDSSQRQYTMCHEVRLEWCFTLICYT